jgi:hypothetical protein
MPFSLISQNVCAAAYPPPVGLLREGFWRWVGGSTVFPAAFFFIFFIFCRRKNSFLFGVQF